MLSDHEHIPDDHLQMYFDAELPEGESSIVRRHLVGCGECKGRLRAMEQLHSFFEMAAEDVAADLPSDQMFAKIREGLARDSGLRVVDGGATAAEAPKVKRSVWVPIAVGFAVAAAVLIGVLVNDGQNRAREEREARERQRRRPTAIAHEEVAPQPPPVEGPGGTSVHDVNFGENTGTVFQVEGEDGASLAVVWINDDEAGAEENEEVPQ